MIGNKKKPSVLWFIFIPRDENISVINSTTKTLQVSLITMCSYIFNTIAEFGKELLATDVHRDQGYSGELATQIATRSRRALVLTYDQLRKVLFCTSVKFFDL